MTFPGINNPGDGQRHEPLASLLRCEADGELTPDQARVLERRRTDAVARSEDEARLAFERGLRGAVARVMSGAAPADLRRRLEESLRQPARAFADETPIAFPGAGSRGVWGSWGSWGWLAMAAGLLLTLGTGLMMWSRGVVAPASNMAHVITSEQATHLVSYIADQHEHCANFGAFFNQKMTARTEAAAAVAAIELLSKVPSVLDLGADRLSEAGYEFAGLGRCRVPGPGRSAHLIYKASSPNTPAVSLFIQEDTGALALDPDHFYTCTGEKMDKETLTLWRKDGLIYYLFTPDPVQQPVGRELFGAPIRRASLS